MRWRMCDAIVSARTRCPQKRAYVEVDPVCDCGVDFLLPLDFPCFRFQHCTLCGSGGPRQRSRQCRRRSRERRQKPVSPRMR